MKRISRIDIEDHETKRLTTLYKLDSRVEIKVSDINCVKLKNSIINSKKKIIDKKLVNILLSEKIYREITGIKIEKTLKI